MVITKNVVRRTGPSSHPCWGYAAQSNQGTRFLLFWKDLRFSVNGIEAEGVKALRRGIPSNQPDQSELHEQLRLQILRRVEILDNGRSQKP